MKERELTMMSHNYRLPWRGSLSSPSPQMDKAIGLLGKPRGILHPRPSLLQKSGGDKILVVEDSALDQRLICGWLKDWRLDLVITAANRKHGS
jgi:hypothetical protein